MISKEIATARHIKKQHSVKKIPVQTEKYEKTIEGVKIVFRFFIPLFKKSEIIINPPNLTLSNVFSLKIENNLSLVTRARTFGRVNRARYLN